MLIRLHGARKPRDEQIPTGVGAEPGNGLPAALLGTPVLTNNGADAATRAAFAPVPTAVRAADFVAFLRDPERAVIGYKG